MKAIKTRIVLDIVLEGEVSLVTIPKIKKVTIPKIKLFCFFLNYILDCCNYKTISKIVMCKIINKQKVKL
jgi:hypothetical protein